MHRSKLPLRTWFWAIFLVGRDKKGISAVQLQRDIGVKTYRTAWLLLHKIRASFDESSQEYPLRGVVEIDEAYVGRMGHGEHGGRGGSAACVVAAVERTPAGPLGSARMAVIKSASASELARFIGREVDREKALVHTDGWAAYRELRWMGYRHQTHVGTRTRGRSRPVLPAVHLVFSNLKTWLRGRFHGVSAKYLPAYLAEFTYRFNRRKDPPNLFGWVARRLMSRPARTLAQLQAG
jgi:transposase-like protein